MKYESMTERLLANSVIVGECWVWTSTRDKDGYGKVCIRTERGPRNFPAHRIAYEVLKGEPVPASWDVHHTCGNRACINPAHLEAMYHRHNCQTGRRNNRHSGSFKPKENHDGI